MKRCSKCKTEKPLALFNKNASAKSGLYHWCKVCQAAANRGRLLRNPEKQRAIVRKAELKRKYGRTPEDIANLIISQSGCCVICREPFTDSFNTHIDHIHGSNPVVVRGILCSQCNVGLGNFKDSPERLARAIEYLKKFQVST